MSTEIYYFSGTGNSLVVARDISKKMEGNLIAISSIDEDIVTTDADVIGIVFPVYYTGLVNIPLIIQRFVMKLDKISTKYIFAICTYGGGFGSTLNMLDEMVRKRGGRLASGFGVQMPQNAFKKPFENKTNIYNKWKNKKLLSIYEYVSAKNEGHFDTDGFLKGLAVNILGKMANSALFKPIFYKPMNSAAGISIESDFTIEEIMPLMDNSFHTDKNCRGCGRCMKVCPVQNIEMFHEKPAWQHHCENCLACIKWCPRQAIHGYGELPEGYHHPEVKISDMVRENQKKEGML